MKMHIKLHFKSLLTVGLLFSASSAAFSTDYAAGLGIKAEVGHNDNIRLSNSDKTAVTKYNAAPTLNFSAATETSALRLDSTLDFNYYDKSEFNSNDQNIALALSRQFEHSSIGLDAAYINNSTLTSETLTTGRIGTKAERAERYSLSPRWLYTVNETNLLQVQASYTAQDYRSDAYTGYENLGAQISWVYKITERISWVTTGIYSDYQSDDVVIDLPRVDLSLPPLFFFPANYLGEQSYSVSTKNKGLNIGINYEWSEQTSLEARAGRAKNYTNYSLNDPNNVCSNPDYLITELVAVELTGRPLGAICSPLEDSNNFSSTADLTWRWRNERQQASLTGTKETQPTSNGYTVDSIQIGSNWSYQLTELDQLSAAITLVRNRAIDDKNSLQNASNADRDYGSATLAYQRQVNEYWFLRASYQYAKQKYSQNDYEAASNFVAVSINYRPQQWHWSR